MRKFLNSILLLGLAAFGLKKLMDTWYQRVAARAEFVFDPVELQQMANLGAELPIEARWQAIHQELLRRYPGLIAPEIHWVFNAAGNVVCQLALVYGSPTEYVAFFGTPLGASGFSGRYGHADVWDLMVAGKMRTVYEGQFEPTEYGPGDPAYLPRGKGKYVQYVGSTWMIDYGRGLPLTLLPFGIIFPFIFNTLDGKSAGNQLADYAKLVMKSINPK